MQKHELYQVGIKMLLRNGDAFLFLRDKETNHLDLPGGRINTDEKNTPLETILNREVQEELGPDIVYKLGNPIFQYRRYPHHEGPTVFISVYSGEYISGAITLSDEHSSYEWIDTKDIQLQERDFGNTEEYAAMKTYFESLPI